MSSFYSQIPPPAQHPTLALILFLSPSSPAPSQAPHADTRGHSSRTSPLPDVGLEEGSHSDDH